MQDLTPACVERILRKDVQRLEAALSLNAGTARIEVQILLQTVLSVNRAYLLTHPERVLTDDDFSRYSGLLDRRLQGEPIAYILGVREFYGLDFKVTPATLIPRPDTELLVELALQKIPRPVPAGGIPAASGSKAVRTGVTGEGVRQDGRRYRVLDMGTGSGAIALTIAHERTEAQVVAVDASEEALLVAAENANRLQTGNVRLLHSDWFSALADERFDLIVANPPYIESDDVHLSQGDVRFEPLTALASGGDGLDDIRRILRGARTHLESGGWLMFEHGYNQAQRVRALMRDSGFNEVSSALDLSGIERVTLARA
ncbi:MAG: protein-(glutamine-N5) methyltransferase, release factor-specific [Gallionellales bacterium RIFOXYB12_FULL_54_9]|nr:MAG: protein-(glutamine-N5) methyltransferase, release factor-specific [Gallionellales bacterium RIFOXYB12_FULL_54_9]